MRSGDISCILVGAPTPFILRPAGDQYILVGEAYLRGLTQIKVIATGTKGQRADRLFEIV